MSRKSRSTEHESQEGYQGYNRHRPYRREAYLRETPRQQELTQRTIREEYSTQKECEALWVSIRWPDGVSCPRCHNGNIHYSDAKRKFRCRTCRYRFTVTSGTWLHKTRTPLTTWLAIIYEMVEDAHSVSSNEVHRKENINYDTAWNMTQTIRRAMLEDLARDLENSGGLGGTVETDESYTGGKVEGWGRGFKKNKILVLGIIERGGRVYFQVVDYRTRDTLHNFITIHVDSSRLERLYTDDFRAYEGIDMKLHVKHRTVNHSRKEYARGPVHTNSIESMWASWSRMWSGTHHHISRKYAPLYVAHLAWLHNHAWSTRKVIDLLRVMLTEPRRI